MPQAGRKRSSKKSGLNPSEIISTATTSVERIGADSAFYATIIVLSFVALVARVSATEIVLVDSGLTAGWLVVRYFNLRLVERREKSDLKELREARGIELLKLRGVHSGKLTFLDGAD